MLHFLIFCVFIGEGWDTLAKKAVYPPWEEKLRQGAKFWSGKRNNYGGGKKVPTLSGKIRNIRLGRSFPFTSFSVRMTWWLE